MAERLESFTPSWFSHPPQTYKTHAQSPPDALAVTLAEVLLRFSRCIRQLSPMVAAEERASRAVGGYHR